METKYIVNNLSGQTIDGNITINGNLTITGTTNIRPYQVFTALLTQSGGDNPIYLFYDDVLGSPSLTIGVTYIINDNANNANFTNVGAPNNEIGTYFIATGTIPANWGFGALQYNTGAPVATVLENTIGNIWFTYLQPGYYFINSNGLFTVNKTYPDFKNVFGSQWNKNIWESFEESPLPDVLTMVNYNSADNIFEDGINISRIEIRVYN